MYRQEAREEYAQALRLGLREQKALQAAGKSLYPPVLDELLDSSTVEQAREVGLVEIPVEQIVGVKSAGRIRAFTPGFRPILNPESEFAAKWINLCAAHLSEGIREPILCFEYLGKFYIQEGNKRLSVLKHMGAPRITGTVRRILPPESDDPRIRAYYEFLDFYKATGLYQVQFRRPGDYGILLSCLGKTLGERWSDREKRTFSAYYQYFRDAFFALGGESLEILPEEALLLWLQVYPFRDLGALTAPELKRALSGLWEDVVALAQPKPVEVRTEPVETESRKSTFARIITGIADHVNVAFVHPLDVEKSTWVGAHEDGRKFMEGELAGQVTVRSYFHADSPEETEMLLEQAVADGADVVFTTTPQLSRPTLRAALKYPRVRFLNCSVDTPYSSIRTYYSRIYEAKFITGAIAGAMANDDLIGYIGSNPIFGVPASINAFALGAQLTNPRAKVVLRWSCLPGTPQEDFLKSGIRVISNRDVPTQDRKHLDFCNYGTYFLDDDGHMQALASPLWLWGQFYVNVIRSVLAGTWDKDKDTPRAVNYWWGMNSGVIDVELSKTIPDSMLALANILRQGLKDGTIDPFRRRIVAQDGTVKNDGSRSFTPDEVLRMDWLCENVEGSIPGYEELLPFARSMVRQLGVYRDQIPLEKEEGGL